MWTVVMSVNSFIPVQCYWTYPCCPEATKGFLKAWGQVYVHCMNWGSVDVVDDDVDSSSGVLEGPYTKYPEDGWALCGYSVGAIISHQLEIHATHRPTAREYLDVAPSTMSSIDMHEPEQHYAMVNRNVCGLHGRKVPLTCTPLYCMIPGHAKLGERTSSNFRT